PLHDIQMMRSPVGDHSAGIFKEPAEGDMAARRVIGYTFCRSKPHIPVKPRRDRFIGYRFSLRSATDHHFDILELTQAPIADIFTGFAESVIGTLLAAGLENSPRFPADPHNVAPLIQS